MSAESSNFSKLRVWDRPITLLHELGAGSGAVLEPSGMAVHGPHYAADFDTRTRPKPCSRPGPRCAGWSRPSLIRCNGS
jgi:hypothetical protein